MERRTTRNEEKAEAVLLPVSGSQTREGILNMLLQDPELFERIPGITAEQREAYEQKRRKVTAA